MGKKDTKEHPNQCPLWFLECRAPSTQHPAPSQHRASCRLRAYLMRVYKRCAGADSMRGGVPPEVRATMEPSGTKAEPSETAREYSTVCSIGRNETSWNQVAQRRKQVEMRESMGRFVHLTGRNQVEPSRNQVTIRGSIGPFMHSHKMKQGGTKLEPSRNQVKMEEVPRRIAIPCLRPLI